MIKLLSILLLSIALALYASAGWITSVQSATDATIDTQKKQLGTYGQNPRIYLFTIKQSDGAESPMQCIIVYTEQDLGEKSAKSTAPVMQCTPLK